MADKITVPTYEQIEIILSKLATNYSNLAHIFYDVFYNTEPMDVTFQMFDEQGELQTYTIPNRAKDMQNIRSGEGNPEGNVSGSMGTLYQDLANAGLYIKETPTGNEGWVQIATEDYLDDIFLRGSGSPEGVVVAARGVLYIDTNEANLYIKGTITGSTGWILLAMDIDASSLANVDLSNLSPEGLELFNLRANVDLSNLSPSGQNVLNQRANINLSNLSVSGQAILNAKENVNNKVTTLSELSTDSEYPSAKCVYDLLGDVEALINAL